MKNLILLIACFSISILSSQNFTWMRGSTSNGTITGVYGTQGVASSLNDPGTRHGCATWTDANGNLWLFGGEGISSSPNLSWLNDLWKYNKQTNEWTWIRGSNGPDDSGVYGTLGVASPMNEPGAREFCVSWTDASGNFWLFGGEGFDGAGNFGNLGDLWKYNPQTNEWTWMSGHNTVDQNGTYGTLGVSSGTNMPGCRHACGTWTDSNGNFWLFGGKGYDATSTTDNFLNDLWKYTTTTNEWTWVSGSNNALVNGVYGTIQVPASGNFPGGREFPACWKDNSGNVYLFGGIGLASTLTPNQGYLNDLWKYNPIANTWTWLKGDNITNQNGTYGTMATAAATNKPGARLSSVAWEDLSGNFWLFAGFGFAASSTGMLNDLWKYSPTTNEWTWEKGLNSIAQNGSYGSMGMTASTNIPGARRYNTFWRTQTPKLWLMGGLGMDMSSIGSDNMNDVWYFEPPCMNSNSITVSSAAVCSGKSTTLTTQHTLPANFNYYSSATSSISLGSGSVFVTPTLSSVAGSSVYSFYVETNSCAINPRAMVSVTVNALPTVSITSLKETVCLNEALTLTASASGVSTFTWNNNSANTSTNFTVNTSIIGSSTITAEGKDANNCANVASKVISVAECTGIETITQNSADVKLYPNPNKGHFNLSVSHIDNDVDLTIFNAIGEKVYTKKLVNETSTLEPELTPGIYFYHITHKNKKAVTGKLIIE